MTAPLRSAAATAGAAFALVALATVAPAVPLHGGDIVVLAREYTQTPGILVHVNVPGGVIDTITPSPPLSDPRDLVVRGDGTVLVADAALGLVAVSPLTGAANVLAHPADFGGAGPTTLAYAGNGDLLLAGPSGVARWRAGAPALTVLGNPGTLVLPTGIADDGAGHFWLADQGNVFPTGGALLRVDGLTGAVSPFYTTCANYLFPNLPLQVRRGPDGFAYVVNSPYSGPSNYLNGGIFRVDPATGVATLWRTTHFVRGFDFDASGNPWVLAGLDVSRDPYNGILAGGGTQYNVVVRGPLAIVPSGVTPARSTTWGAIKSRYR